MRLGHYNGDGQAHYDPYKDTSTPRCECREYTSTLASGKRPTVRCTNHIGKNPTRCSDGVARCEGHARLVGPKVLAMRLRMAHLTGEQKYFGRPL
jgi:hypothetical protein